MVFFRNQYARNLFAKMHEYAVTGNLYCLPLISCMIAANPNLMFNEKDQRGQNLLYHLLNLPQLSMPAMQLSVNANLLEALSTAGVNPVTAMMFSKNPALLYNNLQQLLAAANHNIITNEKVRHYLLRRDISGNTPVEAAIICRNPMAFSILMDTLHSVLSTEELRSLCDTFPAHGDNFLEHIEFYADIHMLLAYITFLDKALGSAVAFTLLRQQATSKNAERAELETTGSSHLHRAIALLQTKGTAEEKWYKLGSIKSAALRSPLQGMNGNFNFRLFAPPLLPCDRGLAPAMDSAMEEKSDCLPEGLLDITEPEDWVVPRLG